MRKKSILFGAILVMVSSSVSAGEYQCDIWCKDVKTFDDPVRLTVQASSVGDARYFLTKHGFANANKACKNAGLSGYSIWNLGIKCK